VNLLPTNRGEITIRRKNSWEKMIRPYWNGGKYHEIILESSMSNSLCRLCLECPAIENSHVIPSFVFRPIKSDSPTGYFRNPNNPNRRLQDGDKLQLLCPQCEQRFGNAESEFATNVFLPFHRADCCEFSYGPWLHYFMTSLVKKQIFGFCQQPLENVARVITKRRRAIRE